MTGTPVIRLTGVGLRRAGRDILTGVDLTVRTGEHWALLGPNGAGKSTILSLIGAVTHPTVGEVEVLGQRLGRVELRALRQVIGHVNPRHRLSSPLTIRQVVLSGVHGSVDLPPRWEPSAVQIARADELIAEVGLAGKAERRWPDLSQGERGRALIARALIIDPRVLLLDEPTTGLDVAAREQLLETIDRLERVDSRLASVLVTHHLEELPPGTTHAALLADGRIVAAGPVAQVLTSANVSAAFEHPIRVESQAGRWTARAEPTGAIGEDGARPQSA
ncbi:ABC transporter ATP-binding protein [Gordonia sp. VNK21]|uniref:ABC transporter ATP-binding protein n=1 Tax=Gordonia sp. VNK21 TaxID=3382483 RepID=UPI0038D45E48